MNTLLKALIVTVVSLFGFGLVAATVAVTNGWAPIDDGQVDNQVVAKRDDSVSAMTLGDDSGGDGPDGVDDGPAADEDDGDQTRTRTRTGRGPGDATGAQMQAFDDDSDADDDTGGQTRTRTRSGHGSGDDDNSGPGTGDDTATRDFTRDLTDTN